MKVYGIEPILNVVRDKVESVIELGALGNHLGHPTRFNQTKYVSCPPNFQYLESTPPSTGSVKLKRKLIRSNFANGWIARVSTGYCYDKFSSGSILVDPNIVDSLDIVERAYGHHKQCPDIILQTNLNNFWLRVNDGSKSDPYILLFQDDKVSKISYSPNYETQPR
jgi:hypothetical protein